MLPASHSLLRAYAIAGLTMAAALIARFALNPLLGDHQPFCTFYLAVAVAAWFGGLRPALVAVLFGGLAGNWFFVPPRGAFALTDAGDLAGLLTFAAVGVALGVLTDALRSVRQEAARQAAEVQALADSSSARAAALRESEERFTRFMQHLPGLGWIKDAAGRYVYANDAAVQAFGRPRSELYGQTDADLFPADTASLFRENDGRALAAQGAVQTVETLTHPDGTVHHSLVSKFLIPGPDGEPALIGGVAIDVTDRRRAEDAQRESEERLRLTLDAGQVGTWDWDIPADRVAWSARVYEFHGLTPGTFGGRVADFAALIHPDDRDRVAEAIRRAVEEGEPYSGEFRIVRPTGEVRWIATHGRVLRDAAGRPLRMIGATTDVTERRQAEQALRASEERYRTLFETIDEGFCVCEVLVDEAGSPHDYRFVEINPAFESMSGLERAMGRTARELVPNLEEFWYETYGRVALTGEPVRFEHRVEALDRWFDVYASRVGDPSEYKIAIVFTNITARKRAEEALQESEARFRAFADTAPAMLWVTEPDAACSFLSRGWYEFTGQTEATALGFGWLDAVHPDDRAAAREAFLTANIHQEPFALEHRLRRADGEHRWVIDAGRPRFGPGGEFLGYTGSVIDIHDRKLTEQVLRVHRDRLDLVVNSSQVGLWCCDLPFDTLVWNAKVKEHFGLPPDYPVTINTFFERLHPDDRGRTRRAIEASICDRTDYDIEYRTVGLDGRERWVRAIGKAAYDEAGTPRRFDGITVDVTDRVRQQEALREADRRKDEFLATLAHELRNPLAPIRNAVQVFHIKEPADPQLRAARDVIDRQVRNMVRLIDDLLDIGRITRGKLRLQLQRVDLAAVVRDARETAVPVIEAADHSLTIELPPESIWLDADPTRLAQVFANLLTNAAKYTDRGGRIRLTAERTADEVVVAVADTGIGVSAEHLPQLFEMFSQVAPVRERSQGGLGIGLALVRGLVEMHGGTVRADSPGVGRGSTFTVRLPLAKDEGGRMKDEPQTAPVHPSSFRLHPSRVLVIDDSRDGADSLAEVLRVLGYEVRVAYDGPAGLAEATQFRPDAVVCDIGMPGMSGLEVARRLRADPSLRAVRLVAATGWGQDDDRRRSREAGFDHHLTKPIDPADLREALHTTADGY